MTVKYKIGEIIHTVYGTAKVISENEAIIINSYGRLMWLGKRIEI